MTDVMEMALLFSAAAIPVVLRIVFNWLVIQYGFSTRQLILVVSLLGQDINKMWRLRARG